MANDGKKDAGGWESNGSEDKPPTDYREGSEDRTSSTSGGSKRAAADGGWGWLVVLGAALVNMMFGINYRVFGLVYLEMRERFQASATACVWVGGLNLLLGGFCGPLGAWLLQRYSHRAVTAVGASLAVIGMISTGYVPNLPLAYVTYGLLTGVGIALAHTSSVALVGQYFEKRKALALALQSVTSGLSAVIFSPLMALLFAEFSYGGTFLIFGGCFTHMFIACALFRPLEDKKMAKKEGEKQGVDQQDTQIQTQGKPIQMVLHLGMNKGGPILRTHNHVVYNTSGSYAEFMDKVGKKRPYQTEKGQILQSNLKEPDKSRQLGLESSNRTTQENSSQASPKKKSPCFGCDSLLVAVRSPVYIAFFFLLLSVTAGRAVTSSFLPALAVEFGTSLTEAAFLPAISGISASAGSLLVGAAFDTKYVRRYRVYLYALNTFIIGATMLWMPFGGNFTGLAIPTAVNGVSSTVVFAQQMTVLTDLLGREHAVAGFGVTRVALALGSILGRSVSAIFVDTMATNTLGFYITSSLPMAASVAFIGVVLYSRNHRKELNYTEKPTHV